MKTTALSMVAMAFVLAGCTATQQTVGDQTGEQKQEIQNPLPSERDRMVPNPITNEIPNAFFQAVEEGTRTMSGEPGTDYWQQRAEYDMDVELIPEDTLIKGSSTITYHNNSPDTLNQLFLELAQNLHKEGVLRNESAEVTGGINLQRIETAQGALSEMQSSRAQQGYYVDGTLMILRPGHTLAPGESIEFEIDWDFKIPQQGASGRMGYSEDNLFYIAYWYPQMRVYDDVNGWFTDQFKGNAEFYHDFASYNVDITVPEQWIVTSTGLLTNAQDVLKD